MSMASSNVLAWLWRTTSGLATRCQEAELLQLEQGDCAAASVSWAPNGSHNVVTWRFAAVNDWRAHGRSGRCGATRRASAPVA